MERWQQLELASACRVPVKIPLWKAPASVGSPSSWLLPVLSTLFLDVYHTKLAWKGATAFMSTSLFPCQLASQGIRPPAGFFLHPYQVLPTRDRSRWNSNTHSFLTFVHECTTPAALVPFLFMTRILHGSSRHPLALICLRFAIYKKRIYGLF